MRTKLSLFFFVLTLSAGIAQNGTFDTSFGINGHKQFSLGDKDTRGNFLLTLSDESFLVLGRTDENYSLYATSLFIAKFTPDGNLDTEFAQQGVITIPFGPDGMTWISDAIQQPDSKILVLGTINGVASMIRIHQNGDYDTSFGTNGIATVANFGRFALLPDAKIIVVGYFHDGHDTSYHFARYHPDGSADLSFANNGTLVSDISTFRFELANAIKLQGDKIIVVGSCYDFGDQLHATISRFDLDAMPDMSFGNAGTAITPIGNLPGYANFYDVAVVDDKAIAVGTMEYSGGTGGFMGTKPVFVKYNTDGSLDTDFGTSGKVILNPMFNANDNFYSITIQSDGKIIGIGTSGNLFPNPQSYLNISRLHPNGSLDASFGANGTVLTNNAGAETNVARQIRLLPSGKLLCIGLTREATSGNFDVLMCRLNPDGFLDMDKHSSDAQLTVYPNPTNGQLFIKGLPQSSTLSVYNALGQSCRFETNTIDATETAINLSHLPTGTYALRVEGEIQRWMKKIVIE